jgi:hypothetical protein
LRQGRTSSADRPGMGRGRAACRGETAQKQTLPAASHCPGSERCGVRRCIRFRRVGGRTRTDLSAAAQAHESIRSRTSFDQQMAGNTIDICLVGASPAASSVLRLGWS